MLPSCRTLLRFSFCYFSIAAYIGIVCYIQPQHIATHVTTCPSHSGCSSHSGDHACSQGSHSCFHQNSQEKQRCNSGSCSVDHGERIDYREHTEGLHGKSDSSHVRCDDHCNSSPYSDGDGDGHDHDPNTCLLCKYIAQHQNSSKITPLGDFHWLILPGYIPSQSKPVNGASSPYLSRGPPSLV